MRCANTACCWRCNPLDTAAANYGMARSLPADRRQRPGAPPPARIARYGAELSTCPETAAGNDWRPDTMTDTTTDTRELVSRFGTTFTAIRGEVRKLIVGQDEVVEQLLITLLVGGHCLITGLPGTAKTLLVRTLASALGLSFKRIQFTPDLMPTDITGTDILEEDQTTGKRTWTFVPGPLFAHVLLADEINRTPPKTQSALLEAMQELSVTVRGNTRQHRAAVLRAGHAEPHRARRHLSAARSAARPLPVQRGAGLPERRRRTEGRDRQHLARRSARDQCLHQRRGDPAVPVAGAAGADVRGNGAQGRGRGACHASQRSPAPATR